MFPKYKVVVKKTVRFMTIFLEAISGNAWMSLEGNLTYLDLRGINDVFYEPFGSFRRQNALHSTKDIFKSIEQIKRQPAPSTSDFVILPLEASTTPLIIRHIVHRVGITSRVNHILIEKNGKLVFAAYDRFNSECVIIDSQVDETLLELLVVSGIIQTYTLMNDGQSPAA